MTNTTNGKIFEQFTRKYALSKTLRFELKPYEEIPGKSKTHENISKMAGRTSNGQMSNFLHDQEIEDAYQILKPVFDKVHEEFITKSLESEEARKFSVNDYFKAYKEWNELKKKKVSEQDKKKKAEIEKRINEISKEGKTKGEIQKLEEVLRRSFEKVFEEYGEIFKDKANAILVEDEEESGSEGAEDVQDDEKDDKKKGFRKLLKAKFLLGYIEKYLETDELFNNIKSKEGDQITKEQIKIALGKFKKFSTYFGGFELNRLNYYVTKEEKATSVASRIVAENLPKFADNVLEFKKKEDEYLSIFEFLTDKEVVLKGKGQKGEEINLAPISAKIFEVEHFRNCLSQRGIEEYNLAIGNANNLINRYNQQQDEKNKKLRLFKTLYKQVGCGEKGGFIPVIKNEKELQAVLKKISEDGKEYLGKFDGKIVDKVDTVAEFCAWMKGSAWSDGVFWNDKALNTISGKYFADWFVLKKALKEGGVFSGKKKDDEDIKIPQGILLRDLFEVLNKAVDWKNKGVLFKSSLFENNEERKRKIIENAEKPSDALLEMIFADMKNLAQDFAELSPKVLAIDDFKNKEDTKIIKRWLDDVLFVNQIVKYWKVKENKFSVDSVLSEALRIILFGEHNPTRDYDVVRNFLTKKPQEELNKLKLNFDNSSLAAGWDLNKEKDNSCVILKDGGDNKYLAIMKYDDTKIFEKNDNNPIFIPDNSGWTKMEYKLVPGASKTLPKVFFSKKWTENNNPTPAEISRIYKGGSFKKGDSFQLNDLHKLVDFYKEQLTMYPSENESWQKIFNFKFSDTQTYQGVDEFYNEVDKQGYKLDLVPINKSSIINSIENGQVYLFEIRNKDNNLKNGGKKESIQNLHSIYWDTSFKNVENRPKLNGEAEIFYRPALPLDKLKKAIKKDDDGNEIEIKLASGVIALQNYRFAKERFIFHCPITLNFGLKSSKLNDELNEKTVKQAKEIVTIGIDRGEKHLAYYFVIKQTKDGKIESLDQGSFNKINKQDYAEKLEKVARDRDEARKNWETIGAIKELKDGYISQVIRKIVDLAIYVNVEKKVLRENPAFIVLEDLNIGFKRGRQKIEKQVYQKLELALAKKLNFLVDKSAKEGENGSVTRALQLTPPVNNFGDIEGKKQFGIMLYVKAGYTSQTDPATGWRKTIYLKKGSEEYVRDQIIGNVKKKIDPAFDDFGFNGVEYYFTYTDRTINKKWTLYPSKDGKSLERYYRELVHENSDKKWIPKKQDLVKKLDDIFSGFDKKISFLEQIKNGKNPNKVDDHSAWESIRFTIDLIQQIRNTGTTENDSDFIFSPVRDGNGNHFDSRKADKSLPTSGDANGAFNIARKGIIMCEHIKEGWNLFISDDEWSAWLAGEKIWKKWTKDHEDILKKSKKEE